MHRDAAPFLVEQIPVQRRTLRVSVVTETYPPEVNGVATTAAHFVEGLRRRDHQIQLVRPRQDIADEAAGEDGFQLLLTRGLPIPRYPSLKMGLPARRALTRLWSLRRPDVVHIVTEGPLGWSALQTAGKLGLPVVSDFRTNFHAYGKHYGVGWLRRPVLGYLRKFHNRTLATLVPSEALRETLATNGFRNVKVVSRGVDTQLFAPTRRSALLRHAWGASPATPVVMHMGRLAPEKNPELLVAAFEGIHQRVPDARFVIVGDGPARTLLESRLPYAHFAGVRRGEDLATHLASADIFLFPSLTETYGNVTVEAMASGLAVVAFDYGAAGEHIRHGTNGLLAPCLDHRAFVGLSISVASDAALMRRLGDGAHATAALLDWDGIVQRLEAVLLGAAATAAV